MTPCARGCCWNPWAACGKQRTCPCHEDERTPARNSANTHSDPTAYEAIGNVMRERKRK